MSEEYIELRIRKHIAEKICFVLKLLLLILIPYSILAMTFGWWEWWQDWIPDIFWVKHLIAIFFMSLCSIVFIRVFYSNNIVRKMYLVIPLFLTFFSSPICIILQFRFLISEPKYYGILFELCANAVVDFIVSSICSVLYVRHLKAKKKTIIGNTDNQ